MVCAASSPLALEVAPLSEPSSVADLVFRARDGDGDAWDALVERFLPMVTGIIGGFRLSRADADDVNQTVWLRLVEHLGSLREPRALPGWLATTARREAIRLIGVRGRTLPFDPQWSALDAPVDDHEIDENILAQERKHALREAMLEIPAPRRELLTLLFEDPPLAYEEISRRLGIPVGSIGPTRARALAQLRDSSALRGHRSGVSTIGNGGDRDVATG